MSRSPGFDLLVAGAGPAGVGSAIVARKEGLRVAVVDSPADGAMRPGESLPGAALRTLRRLGVERLTDIVRPDEIKPCVANVSAWGSEAWTSRDGLANPEGGGFHLLRHRFDAGLRAHAAALGVDFVAGRICRVQGAEGDWQVEVERPYSGAPATGEGASPAGAAGAIEARFLVDATGRAAGLLRKLGVGRIKQSDQLAAVAWLRHAEGDEDDTSRVKSVEDGWWYTARLPAGLRVVVYHGLPDDVAPRVRSPELFFDRLRRSGLLPSPAHASDLAQPILGADASVHVAEPAAGPGWLAVGDAALSFDPLSSQGVLFALYSGIRGGEAAARCLAEPGQTAGLLSDYRQKVRGVLEANQRARALHYHGERRYLHHRYWAVQQGR